MKSVGIGISLVLVLVIFSLIQGDLYTIISFSGYVGGFFLVLAALFSGAFIDSDSRRVDLTTEGKESLHQRIKWSTTLLLIGLPNIGVFLIAYLFTKF
jgi:hypothetical protein